MSTYVPPPRVTRNDVGEAIRVGMKVGRLDNFKRNGVVLAINYDRGGNQPVLVRWPNLDDVWMHPGILTVTQEEVTPAGDMTERERLARVVFGCHYDVFPWTDAREAEREDYRRIADAILAAGFGDVTAAKAAAWDESAEEHRDAAGNDYGDWPVNPYRAAAVTS